MTSMYHIIIPACSLCLMLTSSRHQTWDYLTSAFCSPPTDRPLITVDGYRTSSDNFQEELVWSPCTSTTKSRKSFPVFPTSLFRNLLTASLMLRLCPYLPDRSSSNMLMYSLEKGNSRASWAVTSGLAVKVLDLSTHLEDLIISPIVFNCNTRVPA
jgi:hypothetical protein